MARRKTKDGKPINNQEVIEVTLSNYLPDMLDQVEAIAQQGLNDKEIARYFGISDTRMEGWKKVYPSFRKALDAGRTSPDVAVLQALYKRAVGYEHTETKVHFDSEGGQWHKLDVMKHYAPDTKALQMWLSNRQPETWGQNIGGTTINNNVTAGAALGVKIESKADLVASILGIIKPKDDAEVVVSIDGKAT